MERGNHLQKRLTVTLAHINISQIFARTKVYCSIRAHWANSAVRQHKQLLQFSFLFVLTVVVLFIFFIIDDYLMGSQLVAHLEENFYTKVDNCVSDLLRGWSRTLSE